MHGLMPLWRMLGNRWRWRLLSLIHARFMVSVVGIVLDDRRNVLLLRHRFWREQAWGLPSGYIRRRERLEDALAREVAEETGYVIGDIRLLRVESGFPLWVEAWYRASLTGGTLRLDRREILDARFFAPDDVPDALPAVYRALIAAAQTGRDEPGRQPIGPDDAR